MLNDFNHALKTFVEDRVAGMVFTVGVVSLRTLVLTLASVILTALAHFRLDTIHR